jgi:hypothetical protein
MRKVDGRTFPLMRPRRVRNPIKATACEPINTPDTYERFPKPREISVANSSRHIQKADHALSRCS